MSDFRETVLRAIRALHDTLNYLCEENKAMSQTISQIDAAVAALQTQVAQQTTVEGSAVTLLGSLYTQLQAALAADSINPQDAPNITAAIASLQTSQNALAQAVTANTPAAGQSAAVNPSGVAAVNPAAVAPPSTASSGTGTVS